jgi:hypothetical protein
MNSPMRSRLAATSLGYKQLKSRPRVGTGNSARIYWSKYNLPVGPIYWGRVGLPILTLARGNKTRILNSIGCSARSTEVGLFGQVPPLLPLLESFSVSGH